MNMGNGMQCRERAELDAFDRIKANALRNNADEDFGEVRINTLVERIICVGQGRARDVVSKSHLQYWTGSDIQFGPADTVSVVGFPFGMTAGGAFGVWATGFLPSEPDVDYNGLLVQLRA